MQRLKELREEKELSQVKLAQRADMNPATVYRIETGKRSPTIQQLERLAEALEVEVEDFFPKAQAPLPLEPEVAGPRLLERAQDAVRQDADKIRKSFNRSFASGGMRQDITSFEEDKFRAELRALGFPDEYFEGFIWPLVVENIRLKEENAMLRDQLQERERAHP